MGKVMKGESGCLFCLRNLKTNIISLNGPSCQSSSIKEKLKSFISPTDYRHVYDTTLFPNPKICKSCVNLVNTIHKNAMRIESLTGTRVNFQLDCESAVNGNPVEKWPDIKEKYESDSQSIKNSPSSSKDEPCKSKTVGDAAGDKPEIVAMETECLPPQSRIQKFQENSVVQDSGEETDDYYMEEESMMNMNDAPQPEDDHYGSCDSSQPTWSVKRRSTRLSAQLPVLSLARVKADRTSKTAESGATQEFKKNQGRKNKSVDERTSANDRLSIQTTHIVVGKDTPGTPLYPKSFERIDSKSNGAKECKLNTTKNLLAECDDSTKECIRPQDLKTEINSHSHSKNPLKPEVIGRPKQRGQRNQNDSHVHALTEAKEHDRQPPDKSIPCEICGKMFISRQSVQRHVNLVHKGPKPKKAADDEPFVCEVNGCNRVFRWKSCMVRHKALKHRKENYKYKGKLVTYTCEVEECKEEFNRRRLLHDHMVSVHGRVVEYGVPKTYKEWLCPDCGMAVIKIQMSRHRDTYHSPGSMFNTEQRGEFVCRAELCGAKFLKTEDLRAHIPSHIGNPPYTCPKDNCTKTFLLKKNLDIHLMIHDDVKPFQCKVDGCGKGFVTQLCLMRHSRTHTDGLYVCPVEECGAKFRNMNSAGGHLASHRGEDPYVCGVCGAVFSSYNMWAKHKKKHSRTPVEKPIKCSKCGKIFDHEDDLKNHLPVHANEKPYTCEVCGMAYGSRAGYRCHMLKHGEKKYICKVEGCGKRFTLPLTFKRHQAVHEKATKLCSSCGKMLKVSLKKHKCATLKEDIANGKPSSDAQSESPQQIKLPHQNEVLLQQLPPQLTMPATGFQEFDQPSQLLQGQQNQHQHHFQPIQQHVHQDGHEMTPHLLTSHHHYDQQNHHHHHEQQQQQQQQPFEQQQHHHYPYQHQQYHQERPQPHHTSLLPFQAEMQQLAVQPIAASPHELAAPVLASTNNVNSIIGIGSAASDSSGIGQSHLINIPSPSISLSNFTSGTNFQPSLPFPSLPASIPSMSSIQLTPFALSSMPSVIPDTLLPPSTVPLTTLISQPTTPLPSMHLVNNNNAFPVCSLPTAPETIPTPTSYPGANLTPTTTASLQQPLSQSYGNSWAQDRL